MLKIGKAILFCAVFIALFSCSRENILSGLNQYQNTLWTNALSSYNENMTLDAKISWLGNAMKLEQPIESFLPLATQTKDNAFRSCIYFFISDVYWQRNEMSYAVFYMNKIREEDYHVVFSGSPLGCAIGLRIIKLKEYPELRISMYKMLLEKFSDRVDELFLLYELSQLYKEQFDIQSAVQVMEQMVRISAKSRVKDDRIDMKQIQKEINFFYSKKDWIYKDLNKLINNIKYAIDIRSKKRLYSFIPDDFAVRFFDPTIQQWGVRELSIPSRWGRNIRFSPKFAEISTEDEVYLETTGWVFPQLTTWYFYFKRVDYPYDNTINGGWEWKGIYFGSWM